MICKDTGVAQAYGPQIGKSRILMIAKACRPSKDRSTVKYKTGAENGRGRVLMEHDLLGIRMAGMGFEWVRIITHHEVITSCIITQQEDR